MNTILKQSKTKALLLFMLFLGLSSGTLYSQTSLSVESNPAVVVKMGDPVSFSVNVTSTVAMPNAEIEIKAPTGFSILSATPALKPGSLSADKLTARVVINVVANVLQTVTFSIQPLCNADAVASASRLITYNLYASGASTALTTKSTQPIGNFYNPILSVTYPPSAQTSLNVVSTRVMLIEQTAGNSYVNNIHVDAVCDTSGLKVTKLEVSKDNVTWTDITSTGLITTANNKYQYNLTKTNTFTPLGYSGNRLEAAGKLYVRETILLKKCSAGTTNYSISYGDVGAFCSVASSGTTTLSVATPGYNPDIAYLSGASPTSPTVEGRYTFQIKNNASDISAMMYNLYVNVYTNSTYKYRTAYFSDASGNPILNAGDTVFINFPYSGGIWKADFSSMNDPSMIAYYQARGLSDLNGDGVYDDLPPGGIVLFSVKYNLNFDLITADCSTAWVQLSSTRRGDLYYKDICGTLKTFSRPYLAGSSTNYWVSQFTFSQLTNQMLSVPNLHVGDPSRLSFTISGSPDGNGSSIASQINTTSTYWTTVTLPIGLDYDPTDPAPIKVSGTTVALADIQVINNQTIKYRNRITANNHSISIAVRANSTVDDEKKIKVQNHVDYGNTGKIYTFGCLEKKVAYVQLLPCSRLELTSFNPERTTFGWTNLSKTTRMTKVAGANVKVANPFDNVSINGSVNVNSAISLLSDSLMVEVKYSGVANAAQPYFIKEPGKADAGTIIYTPSGGSPVTIQIPAANILATYAVENGLATHYLKADIAPLLRSNSISPATGDAFDVTFFTRTTTYMTPSLSPVQNFQMEVYTTASGVKNTCFPLVDLFQLASNKLTAVGSTGGSNYTNPYTWNLNSTYRNSAWGMYMFYGEGSSAYLTGGEYRPNNDDFSDVVVKIQSLVDITRIQSIPNCVTGNETAIPNLVLGTDYTVDYSNGQTIVTMKNVQDLMTYSTYTGYNYWFDYTTVCYSGTGKTISFTTYDYPTSESPQLRTYANASIGTAATYVNPYTYILSSPAPSQSPKGRRAEWTFSLTNQSLFAGTDPVLPYSWFAVECPSGVTPVELIDVALGTPVAATFVSYDTDKYWIKLGDITVNPTKQYKLSCTYTVCTGNPTLVAKFGMSKVAYPDNPKDGYATAYNSPGVLCGVVSTSVNFTPPVSNFTGSLVHTPNAPLGTNVFCQDIDFAATFTNGLQTNVSNMVLNVTLPVGMDFSSATPTVTVGSGAAVNVASAVQSGRNLEIVLGTVPELDAYGTANQSAVVNFKLITSCGFTNGLQIYADFVGESGCGAKTTKSYNSGQIKIAGLSVIPDYLIGTSTGITAQLPLQDATTNNGKITVNGQYVLGGIATTKDKALIDLPNNLALANQSGDLVFAQSGNRLIAPFNATAPVGTVYNYTLELVPTNPASWDCDSTYKVMIQSGIIEDLTCGLTTCPITSISEIKDSLSFSVTKLNVGISAVLKTTGLYNSSTTERVRIEGKLKNFSAVATSKLIFDLYTFDGTNYVPVSFADSLTVDPIPANDSIAFKVTANIANTEDICKLRLVLRKANMTAGMSNNYICEDLIQDIPSPDYKFQTLSNNAMCQTSTLTVGDPAISGYTYLWSSSNANGTFNNSALAQPTFSFGATLTVPTTVTLTLTVTRPGGCVTTSTQDVIVNPLPVITIVTDKTGDKVCIDTDITFTTESGMTNYVWNLGGATVTTSGGTSTSNTAVLQWSTSGTKTVTVNYTNANGCTATAAQTKSITVMPATIITTQPAVDPTIKLSNGYIIPGSNVSLNVVAASGPTLTYQWYWKKLSDGTVVTLSDAGKYSGTTSSTLLISNAYEEENGDYYVTVTGCGTTTSAPVTVIAVANQDASLKDLKVNGVTLPDFNPARTDYMTTVGCEEEQVTILGIPNNPNYTSITGNGTLHLEPGDNLFSITVVAQDMVTTMTYTVNVIRDCYVPKILKDLEDAVICVGDTHTFEIEVDGQGLTYEWYYGLNRIIGANTNTYTVNTAELRDYERYQVVIRSNYNGFKSSAYSKKVRLWVADYLPTTLKFAEHPNPATTGNTYHIKVDGYIDVTKYIWSYDKEGVTFSPGADQKWSNEAWATFGTLSAGTGTLKVTMEHPCGTRELTKAITVKYPTGTEDITAEVVQVYPNPTSGILKVSGTEANQMIRVTDVTGSLKGTYKTQEGTTTIDLAGYAKGTYMVQYDGKTYKVIKK